MDYIVCSTHAEDLPDGRLLEPGQVIALSDAELQVQENDNDDVRREKEHYASLIEDGRLLSVPEPDKTSGSAPPPAPKPSADAEAKSPDSGKEGGNGAS